MRRHFRIRDLDIIHLLADNRSISVSASKVGMAQANLSRLLSTLEERFGYPLFDRASRPMQLTAFGQQLLPHLFEMLKAYNNLEAFTEHYRGYSSGVVTLCAPAGLQLLLAKCLLPLLQATAPELKLTLQTTNLAMDDYFTGTDFPEAAELLLTHALPRNEQLVAKKLAILSAGIYASPAFLSAHPIKSPEDYGHHPCIQYSFMGLNKNTWQFNHKTTNEQISIATHGEVLCDTLPLALSLAAESKGFVFSPDCALELMKYEGVLVPCLPTAYTAVVPVYVIHPKKKFLSLRTQLVLDCITTALSEANNSTY